MRFNQTDRTALRGDSGGPSSSRPNVACARNPLLVPIGIVNSRNEADDSADTNGDLYFAKVEWALNNADGWPDLNIHTAD
jgi:hypothetical protein